jgi:hypothetical protein
MESRGSLMRVTQRNYPRAPLLNAATHCECPPPFQTFPKLFDPLLQLLPFRHIFDFWKQHQGVGVLIF